MKSKVTIDILAEFIANTNYEDLPKDVIEKAKLCILDFLGVTIIGTTSKIGKIIVEFIREFNEKNLAVLIGTNLKASPPSAALANGIMAHSYEFDDTGPGHPGCINIPAALSLAEQGCDGKDLIAAIVLGYEVMGRIGVTLKIPGRRMTPRLRGFHSFTTQGVFGSATAAGKIMKLDKEEIINALGIAGTQSSGLAEGINVGDMTKPFDAGRAAQSGVYSALLSKKGMKGAQTILEGKDGFFKAFSSDGYDITKLTENLGDHFQIMDTFFKFYPCCAGLHLAIEAASHISKQEEFSADEILEVKIKTNEHAFKSYYKIIPTSIQEAQFSLPYVTATALIRGNVTLEDFSDEAISNHEILKLTQKTRVNNDFEKYYPKAPVNVSVTEKNGNKYIKRIDSRKKRSTNDLIIKYRKNTMPILGKQKTDKLLNMVKHLEKVKEIKSLTELLSPKNDL